MFLSYELLYRRLWPNGYWILSRSPRAFYLLAAWLQSYLIMPWTCPVPYQTILSIDSVRGSLDLLGLVPVVQETFSFAVHARFVAFKVHLTASGMAGKCSDYNHLPLVFTSADFVENSDLATYYSDQKLKVTQTAWQVTLLESYWPIHSNTSSYLKNFHFLPPHSHPVNYRHLSSSPSFTFKLY